MCAISTDTRFMRKCTSDLKLFLCCSAANTASESSFFIWIVTCRNSVMLNYHRKICPRASWSKLTLTTRIRKVGRHAMIREFFYFSTLPYPYPFLIYWVRNSWEVHIGPMKLVNYVRLTSSSLPRRISADSDYHAFAPKICGKLLENTIPENVSWWSQMSQSIMAVKRARHCGLLANGRSQANRDFSCVRNINCCFAHCTAKLFYCGTYEIVIGMFLKPDQATPSSSCEPKSANPMDAAKNQPAFLQT